MGGLAGPALGAPLREALADPALAAEHAAGRAMSEADAHAFAWGTDWDENQGAGMFLCEVAARLLGEDPDASP
ncbi:MAG TPA: hypothetical protein VFV66_20655 [Nonomuraea sp.]|nr:hypothetical protein [Nonomuraea sp.]